MNFFKYFFLLFSLSLFNQEALDLYSFSSLDHEKRFYSLSNEISCPLCEGSSISGSSAPIATDMKNIVFNMISEDKTDDQIKIYLANKFGDDILYMPPTNNYSYLLFLFPVVLIIFSLYLLYLVLIKK
jgi:cytochrome c-type biogenesis protein CcmH